MKKIAFFLTAVAVTLFSCEKEQDVTSTAESTLAGKKVTVKASHEIGSDPEAKTVLAIDGSVTWAGGETLKVVYYGSSDSDLTDAAEAGSTATFTFTTGAGNNYLVYPSTISATYDGTDFEVTVPASQDGTFANAAIEVAQYDGSATCHLKNLGALLEITVTADVDQIVLHSNNSTPLVGTATVTFDDGIPSVSSVASGFTSVTLSGLSGAGTYYAAVLPGSYEAGIYVELKKSGTLVGERISGNTLAVARCQIMPLGVGNPGTMNKLFFKQDGTGDGSSWDSPMGPSDLYNALRLGSDTYLFLAQGVYAPGKETTVTSHAFYIYGGFPTSNTGTSLANRDVSNETAITGEDTYRLIVLNNASSKLVADGITFKNAKATFGTGAAVVLNTHGGSSFNNCIFKDNQTTGTTVYGPAVRVRGTVKFTNCTFRDNVATQAAGGAIVVQSSGDPDLTLDNCTFSGNNAPASGANAGAIIAFSGKIIAKNTTFTGNYATNGGVMRINATGGAVSASFSGCTFSGNYSTNDKATDADGALYGTGLGGAVFSLSGASDKMIDLTIDNCSFTDNVAHPSKAKLTSSSTLKGACSIASIGQYVDVRMRNCLLTGNHTGFAAFVVNNNSSLYLDRCRLWECKAMNDATVVYNNDGKVAVHNCVLYNNADIKSQQTGHTNCNFYNTENGVLLLSCCTFRTNTATSLFRGSNLTPDNNTVIINNIISNTNTTGGSFDSACKFTSQGHNIVTKKNAWTSEGVWAGSVSSDIEFTATTGNPATNTTYYYLKTDISGLSFTKATRTDVTTAISTFDTNNSTGVLTWLGADAVSVDVLKNPRGETEIMPGSYEGD